MDRIQLDAMKRIYDEFGLDIGIDSSIQSQVNSLVKEVIRLRIKGKPINSPKKQILSWIKKKKKAIDDPDNTGSMLEAGEADEGIQAQLQLLDELKEWANVL